jgi:hypothetical protein
MTQTMGLAEAAAQLRIPYQDAHRLVLTGRLAGVKAGGRWAVTRQSVEDLQRERQGANPSSTG